MLVDGADLNKVKEAKHEGDCGQEACTWCDGNWDGNGQVALRKECYCESHGHKDLC